MDCYKSFQNKASDKMVENQISLTVSRFHVAVSPFSNGTPQMTSKCGKKKKTLHIKR